MFCAHKTYLKIKSELKNSGLESPDLEARFLMRSIEGLTDPSFMTDLGAELSQKDILKLTNMTERRISGEPIGRILGHSEFWGLSFKVTEDVLDPRNDTETLVQAALDKFSEEPPRTVIDLGTGSGCILITLLKQWKNARGVAVDISEKALSVAKENAEEHGVANRIRFIQSDWGEKINETFDLVVSNPPYIPNPEIESLAVEVKNHDPILALDGGIDGLESYKKIFLQIFSLLNTDGTGLFEIGIRQENDIMRLVEESGLSVKRIIPDLAGIPRVVEISCGDK